MPETPNRVVIDRVDWKSVLPVLRLASAFRHALQPGKLIVALLAVLTIHLSGTLLDVIWFGDDKPGVYAGVLDIYSDGAGALMHAALGLNVSFDAMNGVPNILGRMVLWVPTMLFQEHPWFVLTFGLIALVVIAIASGLLTRMSASQVCANRSASLGSAAGYVRTRWVWYLLTPLMPAMLIAVVGAVLALAGLVLFNIPGVDVVGSLGYGLLLLLGFVIAIVTLLLLFALFLMPPALSVEGSDGFDAIARSFNYILFRPWQFGAYLFAAVVYLAVVYVLVGTVAALTLDATAYFVDLGTFAGTDQSDFDDRTRFEAIAAGNPRDAGGTIEISAWLMARWFELVTAIVAAILFSTFCCLQTQVYVLMRRSADGTPLDQFGGEEPSDLWADEPVADEMSSTPTEPGPDQPPAGS